jgi:hypothetical protein
MKPNDVYLLVVGWHRSIVVQGFLMLSFEFFGSNPIRSDREIILSRLTSHFESTRSHKKRPHKRQKAIAFNACNSTTSQETSLSIFHQRRIWAVLTPRFEKGLFEVDLLLWQAFESQFEPFLWPPVQSRHHVRA